MARAPQPRAVPPALPAGGSGSAAAALGNLVVAAMALTLVAGAGVLFMLFVVARRLLYMAWLPVATVFGGFTYMVTALLVATLEKLLTWAIMGTLSAGAVYMVLELSPRIKATVQQYYARAQGEIQRLTGVNIAIPSLHEVMDILTRKGSPDNLNPLHPEAIAAQMRELERIKDIRLGNVPLPKLPDVQLPDIPHAAQLKDIVRAAAMPKELAPLLDVTMQPQMLAQFQALERSGALQKGAEAALPLLQHGLYSPDPALGAAALQSLQQMNTPQSRKVLGDYQRLIQQIMQDAAHGANTGH